jgi:hypothetical protein
MKEFKPIFLFIAVFVFSCSDKILDPIKYVEEVSSSSNEVSSSSSSSSSSSEISSSSSEESSSSSSSLGPAFGDCVPQPPYMAQEESITDLVAIEDDAYGTCGEITYTVGYSPSASSSVSLESYSAKSPPEWVNLSITANAECDGVALMPKTCIVIVAIAKNHYKVEELDEEYTFSGGRIVIEFDGVSATHIKCKNTSKIGYILNGDSDNYRVNEGEGWRETPLPPYSTSGNRIYLREFTDSEQFTCVIFNQ